MAVNQGYITSQNNRYNQAVKSGDKDLLSRLQADAKRNNFSLTPQQQKQPASSATLDPGQAMVRKFFQDNGITDVGFDKGRNMITANGMDALTPDKIVNGSAVAGMDALDNALMRLRTQGNQNKVTELLGKLEGQIGQAPATPQFSYDPNSDPVYQAILRAAQGNIQTGTNNNLVALGRRGIGNSQSAITAAEQIKNSELGRVQDRLTTELLPQAYARYRDQVGDQYRDRRDQISDVMNLLGITNEQAQQLIAKSERDRSFDRGVLESDRVFDRGVYEDDRNYDRGVLESDRGFDRGVLESDRGFNRGVLESDRSYKLSSSNSAADNRRADEAAGRAATNDNEQRLFDIWEKTGIAPAGIEGVAPGTPLYDRVSARDGETPTVDAKDSAEYYSEGVANLQGLNKGEAQTYAKGIRDYLTDSDYKALLKYIEDNM